jgi:uncharacterized protein (TIGR03435 family)
MSGFADALTMFVGKPVVDETSLKGDYLFTLEINADTMYAMNQNMFRANPLPAPGGGAGGQRGGRGGGGGGPATAPGQGPPARLQVSDNAYKRQPNRLQARMGISACCSKPYRSSD